MVGPETGAGGADPVSQVCGAVGGGANGPPALGIIGADVESVGEYLYGAPAFAPVGACVERNHSRYMGAGGP